jgi:hypothetical protein
MNPKPLVEEKNVQSNNISANIVNASLFFLVILSGISTPSERNQIKHPQKPIRPLFKFTLAWVNIQLVDDILNAGTRHEIGQEGHDLIHEKECSPRVAYVSCLFPIFQQPPKPW